MPVCAASTSIACVRRTLSTVPVGTVTGGGVRRRIRRRRRGRLARRELDRGDVLDRELGDPAVGEQQADDLDVGAHERSVDGLARPEPHAIGGQRRAAEGDDGRERSRTRDRAFAWLLPRRDGQ